MGDGSADDLHLQHNGVVAICCYKQGRSMMIATAKSTEIPLPMGKHTDTRPGSAMLTTATTRGLRQIPQQSSKVHMYRKVSNLVYLA